MRSLTIIMIGLLCSTISFAGLKEDLKSVAKRSHRPIGYQKAQVELMGNVALVELPGNEYAIHEVYCQELYGQAHLGNDVGPNIEPNSTIINVEHTMPQSMFKSKGYFREAVGDLHHLYPSDSPANAMRGNFPFGEVSTIKNTPRCFDQSQREYKSGAKLGESTDGRAIVFEPPAAHKGNVARAIFYFSTRYDYPIDPKQEAILRKWNKEDPVDQEEKDRNSAIEKIQGNRNPYIDDSSLIDQIADF